jgi:hypothetical protein
MARPSPQQAFAILERRKRVAEGYLCGRWQSDIAVKEGVSREVVKQDILWLRKQWLAEAKQSVGQRQAQELAKIDRIETTAWEAWDRSCQNAVTEHTEIEQRPVERGRLDHQAAKAPPKKKKVARTVKHQAGDPRFLERVGWCIEQRCKILGLVITRHEHSGLDAEPIRLEIVEEIVDAHQISLDAPAPSPNGVPAE